MSDDDIDEGETIFGVYPTSQGNLNIIRAVMYSGIMVLFMSVTSTVVSLVLQNSVVLSFFGLILGLSVTGCAYFGPKYK